MKNAAPDIELKKPVRMWPLFVVVSTLALGWVLFVTVENVNGRLATLENRANHYRDKNLQLVSRVEGLIHDLSAAREETSTNFLAQGEAIALAVQIAEEKRVIAPEALVRDIEATLHRARAR